VKTNRSKYGSKFPEAKFSATKLFANRSTVAVGAAMLAASSSGLLCGSRCEAALISLSNGNSSVTINPNSSAGLENWSINGQNQVNQEWFWYRVGSSGGQSSIDTISSPSTQLYDTTSDGSNDTAMITYADSSLDVSVLYRLSGGQNGTLTSDLGETIEIENLSKATQTFSFFEYSNFTLEGLKTGQSESISGSNTAIDSGNGWQEETTVSPKATDFDANTNPTLLNKLTTATDYTLPNVATSGPGDVEGGFEWTVSIMGGCSYEISGDQIITGQAVKSVPEPVSASLAAMALGGVLMARPRKKLAI
jgi:hypothetical protein